jgi:hypothetical protein
VEQRARSGIARREKRDRRIDANKPQGDLYSPHFISVWFRHASRCRQRASFFKARGSHRPGPHCVGSGSLPKTERTLDHGANTATAEIMDTQNDTLNQGDPAKGKSALSLFETLGRKLIPRRLA